MVRLLVVGQSEIELDGKRLTTESEIVFGMLLYLAARAGEMVSREEAQALFWPQHPHARGRHCLRQALYRLRQLGVPLRSDNGAFGIALGDVTADYSSLTCADVPPAAYRELAVGDILRGYQPVFATPFSAWVEEFRSRIGLRIRQRLVRSIVDLRAKGRYREAEPLARICLTADPYNEIATLTLAEATAILSGNRAEAMAILDRYMEDVGTSADRRVTLAASILRRRIGEQFVEQRYGAPPEPPFVGREDVLQLMVEKMQETVAGRSTAVYLWGEPGIGKTRLLEEFGKIAHLQGIRIVRYAVSPNDPDRPLAVFSAMLPQLIEMQGAAGISPEAYEAIQRFIDPAEWERGEPPSTAAEAYQVFRRLKAGIVELIHELAHERPLGLWVDDLHWTDPRSLEVLTDLMQGGREHRVTLVMTSREPAFGKGHEPLAAISERATVRRLDGLSAIEIETLLARIAEQRSIVLSPEFVTRTVTVSAGNPLFVSELTTHYGWNGVRDDLPANLQTLLQKRLDALSADALLVFQACAVLAEHATVERIGHVLQTATHSLLRSIIELEHHSLIWAYSEDILCRHELLGKEALERLTPIARATLHQKAASVLQTAALHLMSGPLCFHAIHMWLAAGRREHANKLVLSMSRRLLNSGLSKEADALLTTARTAFVEGSSAAPLLALHWRAARAHGDLKRAREFALEYQQVEAELGHATTDAMLAEFAAFDTSRIMEARALRTQLDFARLERAVESPDALVELALRMVINAEDLLDTQTTHKCFSYVTANRILQRATRSTRLLFELVYHSHYGDLDVAVARARQIAAIDNENATRDVLPHVQRLRWAHRPLLLAGLFDEAVAVLNQSANAARRVGSEIDELVASLYRAETLIIADRIDEADIVLTNIDSCERAQMPFLGVAASAIRACLMFARGEADKSQRALDIMEASADPQQLRRNIMVVDSLRVLLALQARAEPDASRVDRIADSWKVLASAGAGDLPFLALSGVFLTRGMPGKASDLSKEYQFLRRERFKFPRAFADQLQRTLSRWTISAPSALNSLIGAVAR